MPVVEKVAGGVFYHRGLGQRLSQGDRVEVSEGLAEYLCDERGEFERLVAQEAEFREIDEDSDDGEEDDESDDEAEQDEGDGFDAAAFVDRTPMDDVVADIEAGEVDDHLDDVADAEADGRDRVGVQDAIGQRRAELEE